MKRLIRHLLLLGAILGLAGNGVAQAAPCSMISTQSQSAMAAGMPDCDMPDCPNCDSKGDKNTKPGCMMMSGCTALLAAKIPTPASAAPRLVSATYFWSVIPVLAGRDVPPEPEPPTFLG
ncbi:MAG: hypothetical protein BVN33_17110 [Proteobacteria bacterium ST_bin13]|nr:MAG: hypothetical protein BVN33_17110 [Proteobacteria bacterium ST_bin13]